MARVLHLSVSALCVGAALIALAGCGGLTLFRGGRELLHATVAIGSAATPTPTGRYYVNQRLIPGIARGRSGPARSGRSVSNGCIRLPNPVLRRVFRLALAGTPVIIHP